MTMIRPDAIVISDEDSLAEFDAALANLAALRHESPEALARFEAVFEDRPSVLTGSDADLHSLGDERSEQQQSTDNPHGLSE